MTEKDRVQHKHDAIVGACSEAIDFFDDEIHPDQLELELIKRGYCIIKL